MQPGRNKPFKDVEKVRFLLHTLDKENPKETSKLYKRCCAASVFVGFLICCKAAAGVGLHGKKKYCAGPSNLGILKSLHIYIYILISGPTSFLVFLLYKDFNLTEADCFSLQGCFSDCSDVSPASAEAESSWIRAAPLGVFLQSAER